MALILVVEDDANLRHALCRYLRQNGHATVPAGTGKRAISVALSRGPDLAVLDLRLPDMDGLSVFTALRRELPSLVGIIITGFGTIRNAVACTKAGIADYVEKPFTMDEAGRSTGSSLGQRPRDDDEQVCSGGSDSHPGRSPTGGELEERRGCVGTTTLRAAGPVGVLRP